MMKRALIVLLAVLPAVSVHAQPTSPEQQLAFAEQLYKDGDETLALLEYRRFRFHNPQHARANEAGIRVAELYIGTLADAWRARMTLKEIGTEEAKMLGKFIQANDDSGSKPLSLYFGGRIAAQRGDGREAALRYRKVIEQYPKSVLVDDALYGLGMVQLEQLHKPADAATTFEQLQREYPSSGYVSDAAYRHAIAVEQRDGANAAATDRYKHVAKTYPNSDAAKLAQQRMEQMHSVTDVPKRQFNAADAAEYSVKRGGYGQANNRFDVAIEVPKNLSDQALKATMESALMENYSKRTNREDTVRIEAYYSYPITEAGSMEWRVGQAAQFEVKQRAKEDVVTDVLLDLFRKK